MEKMPITKAGFEKLKKDLETLKNVSIPENVRDIEVARAHGDISENAEYTAAKERQSFLYGKMNAYAATSIFRCNLVVKKPCTGWRARPPPILLWSW